MNWDSISFENSNPVWLIISILLIPLNWFVEWKKWSLTLTYAEISADSDIKKHSFFAGIVTGMLTPNMLGNFLGRIYYFQRSERISIIVLTLLGNFSQFVVSILIGIISILILQKLPIEMELSWILPGLVGIAFIVILIYFNFELLFKWFKGKAKVFHLIRNLKNRRSFRWKLLLYSFLRHSIFTLQFIFVLGFFGEDISIDNILWVWQYYLWVTLAPSIFLGKLAVRETVAIWVLSVIGMSDLVVILSSLIIWTFNLLIPTLLSLFLIKRKMV